MHSMHKVLQDPVKSIMMRIGMKIVESSDIVKQSIEEVKLKVLSCSPGLALKYILETDVKISGLHIEQSCFTSVEHFKELISFIIRCNQFERVAEGLPLCLTQDQFLQKFDSNNPVFCSMYVSLIPGSANEFMHKDIVNYFEMKNDLFQRGVLKELSVHDLHSRLSFSYNETDYHGGNDLDVESFLLKDTGIDLRMFFKFLHEKSVKSNKLFSVDQFVANVSHFKSWSFLPTQCTANGCAFKYLIPLDQPNKLYKGENSYENIHLIISKLNIPTLDTSWLPSDKNSTNWGLDIERGLESMIASVLNPVKLISCLNIYKEKLQGRVTRLEAVNILGYISERIAALNCHADLDFMIRSLPLYETVFRDLISIENVNNVVILSKRIPPDGMKEIAEATNTTFVMFHERYSYLLKQFSPSLEVDGLYADIIVPNFRAIPPKHQLKHLEYIRDRICRDGTEASRSKQKILLLLTDIPFIQIGNRMRRVNEFFSHRHAVFTQMLTDDKFLPKHLRTDVWKKFLEALGLITMPTQQKVLEFAKTIALDSASNAEWNTDVLKEKSQTLTLFILTAGRAFFSSSNLQELKNIKFVNSHAVDVERRALYHSFIKSNEFICFNGSTTSDWQDICWSSTPILHSDIHIRSDEYRERREELGVLTYPSIERVIVHSHNVTEVFHKEFKRKITNTHDKMKFITPLYDFFMKHLNSPELAKLRNSYFVHIPNEAMVRADMVFESSALKSTEIKPYLYELPKPLRKYIELFEKLGTMSQVCRSQFVNVLQSIHTEYSDQTLPPQVLKKVAQTITLLFKLHGPLEDNHSKLFLPNKEMKLKESSSLTVCDNNTYADILRDVADIDYFLGFQEMEIEKFTDSPAMFESLPDSMQPCFLSKDVRESVSLESIEVVESLVSYDWQYFLRSDCLINGIIRLIRSQCGLNYKGQPTTDLEDRSRKKLKNVRINQVNGLQTRVSYKGSVLNGVSLQRICYTKNINCINGNSSFQLYFDSRSATDETMIISEEDGIFHLVQKCTEHILDKDKCFIMSALLNYRNTPDRISELLDRNKIAQVDFRPSSVFPKPGTYVNPEFYPFLVQEIVPFDEHEFEFVAMEVEYEDDENNAFIYVHIISQIPRLEGCSNIALHYKVNAGENRGFIKVPIFKLYRFVSHNSQNTNREVELYDTQNIISLPFDENCRRLKELLTEAFRMCENDRKILIKRCLFRWHPDRNPGKEEYSSKMFNYLKELIVELEKCELSARFGEAFSSNMFRSRYSNFSTGIERKGRVFAKKIRNKRRNYHSFFYSGFYTGSSKEYVPVPNIGEAKRWLRQAKTDFHVACGMLANPEEGFKGFNWICYQLHQACEKALKAARFSRDANQCPRWSHNLCSIADGVESDDIKGNVRVFESRLNISDRQYFRLRYPDAVEMDKLPSDVFSSDDAAFAKETAHEVIAFVEDYIE